MLEIIIIDPPSPRSPIAGSTMLASQNTLFTLVDMILSNISSDAEVSGPKCGFDAALHTRLSMRPHFFITVSTRLCAAALSPTLHGTASASCPRAVNSAATASHASALRLEITTFAPRLAISSAMDLPMPLVEPVISATFPLRLNMFAPVNEKLF